MVPKLIQTEKALYNVGQWDGENISGILPYGNLILVMSDECAERSAGGLYYDDETRERMTMASETGVIVAIGSQAFKFTLDGRKWPDDDPAKPKVGDRIYHARYAGALQLGFDKRAYRIMNDSAISALIDMRYAPYIEIPQTPEYQYPSLAEALADAPQGESMSIGEHVVEAAGGPILGLQLDTE